MCVYACALQCLSCIGCVIISTQAWHVLNLCVIAGHFRACCQEILHFFSPVQRSCHNLVSPSFAIVLQIFDAYVAMTEMRQPQSPPRQLQVQQSKAAQALKADLFRASPKVRPLVPQ
jgi:hypothetical protein